MQCKDLTFVSKRIIDPKDLPNGYLIKQLGLKADDPLVKRKRVLSWKTNPALCKDWCKALASKISDLKNLKVKKRLMARGQMMMAYQFPMLYVKKVLEKKVQVDEENQRKYKALMQAAYLWQLQGTRRRESIIALARLFEVDPDMMSAWVDMVLANNLYAKSVAMKSWLEIIGIKDGEGYVSIIKDYSNQSQIFYNAVLGFDKFAKTIGVPTSFLNALANGFTETISAYPELFNEFVKNFIGELGVESPALQESIANFINGENSELEPFGKALGFNSGTLATIVTIFGNNSENEVIEKIGNLMRSLKVDPLIENTAKALLALSLGSNSKFIINPQGDLSKKASSSEVLSQILGIPNLIINGMISASKLDVYNMTTTIVEMARLRLPGFQLEESHCRGFISMALGQVQNVEDICSAIKFDADTAEVLVTLTGSSDINHTSLKTSSSFQKIALKLGLADDKAAAIIALTRADMDHVDEIAQDLDDTGKIHADILKGLLSIYSFLDADGKAIKRYKPALKTKILRKGLP